MKPSIRLLYAEDNAQDADLTRSHFAQNAPEFDIQIVTTGAACLEQIRLSPPDLLLLDHHLPDADGVEMLRTLLGVAPGLPIVIVTGVGDEDLAVSALRLGAQYVPKRANYLESLPHLLLEVLMEHRRQQGGVVPATVVPRRILYVEHLPMDIDLTLRHVAETAPHLVVDTVHTCAEALVRLAQSSAYDLALIDVRMPDQNGLDFVREARVRRLPLPPFIMISGAGDEESAVTAFNLGAADYIIKRKGYLNELTYRIDGAINLGEINRGNEILRAEITERKAAEEELARVSGYSRSLIEASLDPLVTISAAGLITDANTATETITGLLRQALIGSDFSGYFTDPDQARAGYQEAFTAGSVTGYPLTIRHVDGSVTDVLYNAAVYRDADGVVAGIFAAARDITESKAARDELAGQTERLELVLRSSLLGLWDWNMVTGEVVADERWAEIVGYRLEELQPVSFETWQRLGHPDDLAVSDAMIEEHMAGRSPSYDIECRMRHRDGHWVWVRMDSG
jgi:PAS domain S-box-containing protein